MEPETLGTSSVPSSFLDYLCSHMKQVSIVFICVNCSIVVRSTDTTILQYTDVTAVHRHDWLRFIFQPSIQNTIF